MDAKTFWIRNATLITGDGPLEADLRVAGERIAELKERGNGPTAPDAPDVDGTGLWLLPGGVDAHVHFGMPLAGGARSRGWRESSAAALRGGTTAVIDFANPERGEPLPAAVARWREAADGRCLCDYGLHVTVCDAAPERLAEIPALAAAGCPTFKAFLAYKGRLMLTPVELDRVMAAVRDAGGRLLLHAEDGELNAAREAALIHTGRTGPAWHPAAHPPESEIAAVDVAIDLAAASGCPLTVVHVSTAGALAGLRDARAAGADVAAEACIQHLYRDEGWYAGGDGHDAALAAIFSPPLRSPADAEALRAGLAAGDVAHVATDHCEFPLAVKRGALRGGFPAVPNGAPGVGERLIVAYTRSVVTGNLSPADWVRLCCEAPARGAGLARKGRLAAGADADLVLFDPAAVGTRLPLDAEGSLWVGHDWRGAVRRVWRRGELVVEEGILKQDPSPGRFLARSL